VILLVAMVLVLFVIVRFAWSFFRGDVPMEAGGSMGDQFFGRRDRAERPAGSRSSRPDRRGRRCRSGVRHL